MDILLAIGLDQTILAQFILFLITFIFLNTLVFKPYFAAFEERSSRTVGDQDLAEQVLEETKTLQLEYEQKARKLNLEHKTIYDESKTKALEKYDSIVSTARDKAKEIMEANRTVIKTEVDNARGQLTAELPAVSKSIATKLLGKELN